MRKIVLVAIIVIAVVALLLPFGRRRLLGHRLELRTYFQDAQGLRAGAPVRLAGVEVGTVTSVRARPDVRENPAEVVMLLSTPYELKVPSNSVVVIETAGVLGETFAEIDVQAAFGPPAQSGSVLKARETELLTTKQLLEKLETLSRKPCGDQGSEAAPSLQPKAGQSGQKPTSR